MPASCSSCVRREQNCLASEGDTISTGRLPPGKRLGFVPMTLWYWAWVTSVFPTRTPAGVQTMTALRLLVIFPSDSKRARSSAALSLLAGWESAAERLRCSSRARDRDSRTERLGLPLAFFTVQGSIRQGVVREAQIQSVHRQSLTPVG